jgi:peptidoglycan/LPS O-acetylase OafA/YrhL
MKRLKTNSRLPQLDVLRAVAILIVLLVHVPCNLEGVSPWFRSGYEVIVRGGWVGVDLFFVLSGFLISSLLFKEQLQYGTINFKRFFLRRGLKIYPSFYFLFFLTIAVFLIGGRSMKGRAIIDELFFLQNYGPYLWYHCWSLAIEEHFYIFLPIALILAIKWNPDKQRPFAILPTVFCIIGVGVIGLRILILLYGVRLGIYNNTDNLFAHTHARIDSLLFGVLLSYYSHYNRRALELVLNKSPFVLLAIAILLLAPPFLLDQHSFFILSIGFSLNYLGLGIILLLCLRYLPSAISRGSWLYASVAYIGTFSYSIYLWHAPFTLWGVGWLRGVWPSPPFHVVLPFYLLGSLLLGIVASKIIELPILRLRDRLLPSRSKGMTSTEDVIPSAR